MNLMLPDKLKVEVDNVKDFPSEIEVKNLKEYPKEIKINNLKEISKYIKIPKPEKVKFPKSFKISNLSEIDIPSEIDLKDPGWLKQLSSDELMEVLIDFGERVKKGDGIKVDLDRYRDPKKALSVRLSNGRQFYNAVVTAFSAAAAPIAAFKNAAGAVKQALVDGDNIVVTNQGNRISTTLFNSRDAATLAANAKFQGEGEDVSKYGRVGVSITSDNKTNGVLTMEVSRDNVTWGGPTRAWADTRFAQPHMWEIVEQYFRIKYVNGTTEATNLAIQVQYSNNGAILLGHQLDETLLDETEALIVRAVSVGQDPNDAYKNEGNSGIHDGNSSTTNLTTATSLVFTGAWVDVSGYHGISVLVDGTSSGVVSGTLQQQFSHDGVTVHRSINTDTADVTDTLPRTLGVVAKFFRIIYTSDGDLLTFNVQTMLHTEQIGLVSRMDQTIQGTEDVNLVRDPTDFYLDAARKHIAGQRAFFFFGHNNALQSGVFEDVWAGGGDIQWQTTAAKIKVQSSDVNDDSGREVTKVICDTRTNTTDGQYFDISAQDGTLYRVYMDTTGADATQPAAGGRTLTKVDIFTGVADTIAGVGDALAKVLNAQSDFISAVTADGIIFCTDANAGTATDAANGDLGGIWAISTDTQGATAGVGLHSVEVHGLSDAGVDQDEVIFLNGTTAVESNLTYMRVNLVHNEEVGTYGGSHEGNIEIRVTNATFSNGDLLGKMEGIEGNAGDGPQYGYGEAQNGFTSVPLGKVLYITRLEVIPKANKAINVILYERDGLLTTTSPYQPRRVIWSAEELEAPVEKEFKSHIKIKALADLFFRAEGQGGVSGVDAELDYYLVDADADGA